jgi:hypothetical protein
MLILWDARLVLLATPRCASTALQAALVEQADAALAAPWKLNHLTAARYARHISPLLEDLGAGGFRVAGLIREPVSWIGSWYRGQRDIGGDDGTRFESFAEFVDAYISEGSPLAAEIGDQSRYLVTRRGIVATDLHAYEDIAGFLCFLQDRIGTRFKLPRENVSSEADMTLAPALEQRLRRRLYRDIRLHRMARRASHPLERTDRFWWA